MADKLHAYQGPAGRIHELKMDMKSRWKCFSEKSNKIEIMQIAMKNLKGDNSHQRMRDQGEYAHVFRRKTRSELYRLCCSVMGIEFAYAAETAFVTPALLQIGVPHSSLSLVWALSPLIGFFAGPILGSMSDRCTSKFGRRRPFILGLSILVVIGLLLIPNGEQLGYAMGDNYDVSNQTTYRVHPHRISASRVLANSDMSKIEYHKWGAALTIVGTVLLDFAADASQNPARAYLVDVCIPEDHAKGLSSFTILAGFGGAFGYSLGAINWDVTILGEMLGGHMHAVFTLVTIIFVICLFLTITSFKEIPLTQLSTVVAQSKMTQIGQAELDNNIPADVGKEPEPNQPISVDNVAIYGTVEEKSPTDSNIYQRPIPIIVHSPPTEGNSEKTESSEPQSPVIEEHLSLSHYLMTIFKSPKSIRMICITNLFCWMAHVCYSLYFTDFVGEAVFLGDPKAPIGSKSRALFEQGVRFGCWGMATYSLTCSLYSMIVSRLIKTYGTKNVYVGGLMVHSIGMLLMAFFKNRFVVIFLSGTAGVMYSTLFTIPYLLIARYHDQNTFETTAEGEPITATQKRGLGTDIALAGSMVFVAQFILSLCVGSLVSMAGTTTVILTAASFLAACGAIVATKIMYVD